MAKNMGVVVTFWKVGIGEEHGSFNCLVLIIWVGGFIYVYVLYEQFKDVMHLCLSNST